MNWLPHDLATWAFVLSVLALALMLPMNLAANLTSPMLRDWWAARSHKALAKRRDKLLDERNELRGVPVFDESTVTVLWRMQVLHNQVALGTHAIIGSLGAVLFWLHRESMNDRTAIVWICGPFLIINLYRMVEGRISWDRYFRRVSPVARARLDSEIAGVERKVAERSGS
jgi:hypothetical protein